MELIGYSTGALSGGDVRSALGYLEPWPTGVVELSALRTHELEPLIASIAELPLNGFRHVSVHGPSAFTAMEESRIAKGLLGLARLGWLIVMHPDTIRDFGLWESFGDRLCIENMDKRKPTGRTVEELFPIFRNLPAASFCFDIAHARQCDTSMTEAFRLLQAFGDRLAQVHVSELNARSQHVRLTRSGVWACQQIARSIPLDIPVIIEASVQPHEIEDELAVSLEALVRAVALPRAA
jgi:hypothetical protein